VSLRQGLRPVASSSTFTGLPLVHTRQGYKHRDSQVSALAGEGSARQGVCNPFQGACQEPRADGDGQAPLWRVQLASYDELCSLPLNGGGVGGGVGDSVLL
jgi:hypothetical protein